MPTEEAATLALRTQQVLAYESGLTSDVDPFGGSYFVEALTREMEEGALAYFEQIDRIGGMVEAIEQGFPQKEIAEASYRFQQAIERKEKVIVGVNEYAQTDEPPISILYIDDTASGAQASRLTQVKTSRNVADVQAALARIRDTARGTGNLMEPLLDAARAYATLGEMCDALRDVWGEYEETPVI